MDQGGNINDARVGQNINQDNNRIEVPVYAWVIGFFVACFVGWYFFIKTDADEKCDTGFILENGKCVAVKMAEPITVPPGSVPLITPTGIVAVPAGPINVPVVIADPVNMPDVNVPVVNVPVVNVPVVNVPVVNVPVAIKPSAVPVSEFVRKGATNSANKWRCGPVGSVGNGYGCTGDKFCTSHNWCESDQTKHTPNSDIRYRIYDGDI